MLLAALPYLSIALFSLGLFLFAKRQEHLLRHTTLFIILYIIGVVSYLTYITSHYFTGEGITFGTLYHLRFGLGGAGFGEYWKLAGILVAVLIVAAGALIIAIRKKSAPAGERSSVFSIDGIICLAIALTINPASLDLISLAHYDGVFSRAIARGESNFHDYYRQPHIERVGDPTNLVFIYLEGFEQTYSNADVFPGLTPNLDALARKGISFTNLNQTPEASFTISGIVASQCGVPLVSPSHGNSLSGLDVFMPGAVCLGDLLKQEGYNLSYYGGADLAFAGKGTFYETHGFDEVKGLIELSPTLEDPAYVSPWGLYDDTLFDRTFARMNELAEKDAPFGMFMLTLDTHHPKGFIPTPCHDLKYGDGKNPMLNAVHCSDKLVGEFVHNIQQAPYGNNTTIVITSDHLGPNNAASKLLNTARRRNRLIILPPNLESPQVVDTWGATIDTGVTILPYIGYSGSIGLGRDLLGEQAGNNAPTYIYKNVGTWRLDVREFFDFPTIAEGVRVLPAESKMMIDDRTFGIPALVELNNELETVVKFQFHLGSHQALMREMLEYPPGQSYILVDTCANAIELIDPTLRDTGFCLITGKGEERTIVSLTDDIYLSVEDIWRHTRLTP